MGATQTCCWMGRDKRNCGEVVNFGQGVGGQIEEHRRRIRNGKLVRQRSRGKKNQVRGKGTLGREVVRGKPR